MLARAWHAVVVACVVFGLVLQVVIALRAPSHLVGPSVGRLAGTDAVGRLIRVFSFFTIQSNVLSAAVSAQLALRPTRDGGVWRVVRLDALFGITVTGIVYATVLARMHEPHGWDETVSNAIFHYVVPVLMVLGWLLFGPRPRIDGRIIAWSLAWPVAWLGYTLARGELWNWYPYPFLDVPTHGYARVLVNAFGVTVVFLGVAALYGWGDRRLPAAPREPGSVQDDSALTTPDGLGRPS